VKTYELSREQTVPRPRREVFEFFSRPENLGKITPAGLGFKILTPLPLELQRGSVIDYVLRIAGLPVRWRTLITAFDPPHRFVDEQLSGPYDFWHHTHTFEEVDGGTRITDRVRYTLPLGPLGELAHALFVRRQLRKIFEHRRKVTAELFATSAEGS
jgi:ligand-binding SRPBCC domain-containing protein